jgi:hypothetical protein
LRVWLGFDIRFIREDLVTTVFVSRVVRASCA